VPLPRWVEVTGLGCLDKQTAILGVEFMTLAVLPYEQTIAAGRLSLGMPFLGYVFCGVLWHMYKQKAKGSEFYHFLGGTESS